MTEEAAVSEELHVDLRAVVDSDPIRERRYHRVLLKLSGEVFGGGRIGLDPDVVRDVATQIAEAAHTGVQIAVVVGGGNFFRGAELQKKGLDRTRADYMGMLGIVMNCLALQDFLEKAGQPTRVQTAITMGQIAEPYIPLRAIRHLEKGRVVIFGAGFGLPFFSTDTVATQRALETHSDVVLISKNGVDGVYTADPRKDPGAERLEHVTYAKALRQRLKVVDAAAFALAQENKLPMVVFGMQGEGNIVRAVRGEKIGTLVDAG
jgi:uridylate kinase